MQISIELTFREKWTDPRLILGEENEHFQIKGNDENYITLTDISQIWTPDSFFQVKLVNSLKADANAGRKGIASTLDRCAKCVCKNLPKRKYHLFATNQPRYFLSYASACNIPEITTNSNSFRIIL